MKFERTTEIDAPQDAVWRTLVDIERWQTWTKSMRKLSWIDGAGVTIGGRARIEQPKMPTLVWEVCELEPGASFSWRSKSAGVMTLASHVLTPVGTNRTLVTLGISQSGPFARLLGAATARTAKRYVEMECDGLKPHCESQAIPDSVQPPNT